MTKKKSKKKRIAKTLRNHLRRSPKRPKKVKKPKPL
jgi:hypothetical protein